MRMTRDELVVDAPGHVGQREPALLRRQRGVEVDLEQDVAQLVEHLGVVARMRGVGQLIRLLDRVRNDRALVLLAVPGAVAPQPARYLVERDKGAGGLPVHYLPVVLDGAGAGVCCGAAPDTGAVLVFVFGAFLQLSITKALAQSVLLLYFFW